jgi:prepilin-type N-terminal cleavage/methylation domain-containing protein
MLPPTKARKQAGFSIMELLVAMAILGIVLGASFTLMGSAIKVSTTTYELTDAQENLRIAQEYISRDLTSAGDGLKSIGTILVPSGFVTNYLTKMPVAGSFGILTSDNQVPASTAVPQANPANTIRTGTDRIAILARDQSFNPPVSVPANKIATSGSNTNITITPADVTRFNAGEIIAVASGNQMAFGYITDITGATTTTPKLVLTNSDTYGLNQTGAGTPINSVSANGANPTSIMRVQIICYYVIDSGLLMNSGLLMRRVIGVPGAAFTDSVIADHVLNIQFRYFTSLLNANDEYVQQPVAGLTTPAQLSAVSQVEATVSVETVHSTLNAGAKQGMSSTSMTAVRNMQFKLARTY